MKRDEFVEKIYEYLKAGKVIKRYNDYEFAEVTLPDENEAFVNIEMLCKSLVRYDDFQFNKYVVKVMSENNTTTYMIYIDAMYYKIIYNVDIFLPKISLEDFRKQFLEFFSDISVTIDARYKFTLTFSNIEQFKSYTDVWFKNNYFKYNINIYEGTKPHLLGQVTINVNLESLYNDHVHAVYKK